MNRKSLLSLIVLMIVTATLLSAAGGIFFTHTSMEEEDDASSSTVMAQKPKTKTERRMVDIRADDAYYINKGDSTIFILVGHFAAHHNGAVIMADSAVRYSNHSFECFGNVLINQNSTYVYGNRAEYNNRTSTATVYSDLVKIIDGEAVMYTYNCRYNTAKEMGEFWGGCYVEKGSNLMESEKGFYNTKTHDLTAIRRVEMRDDTYQMRGDSVIFNTETENAQYFLNSNIWNDKDEYLYTDAGYYDKARDLHQLTRNAYILTPEREIWSDSIWYYRTDGHIIGRHNLQMDDIEQKVLSFADYGEWWDEPGNALFTGRPSMINYDNEQRDSVYLKADTLWMYTIPVLPPEPAVEENATTEDAVAADSVGMVETSIDADKGAQTRQERREERREERENKRALRDGESEDGTPEDGDVIDGDDEATDQTEHSEATEPAESVPTEGGEQVEETTPVESPTEQTTTTESKDKSKSRARSRSRSKKNRGSEELSALYMSRTTPNHRISPLDDDYYYGYNSRNNREYTRTTRRVHVVRRDSLIVGGDTLSNGGDSVVAPPQIRHSYLRTMTLSELAEQQSYLPEPSDVKADSAHQDSVAQDSLAVSEERVLTAKELRRKVKQEELMKRDSAKAQKIALRDSMRSLVRYERDSLRRMERTLRDSLRAIKVAERDSLYQLKYGERDSLRLVARAERDSLMSIKVDSIIAKRKARNARLADEEKAYLDRIMRKAQERQRVKIEKAKERAARRGKEYKGPELEDLYPDGLIGADSLGTMSGSDSLNMGVDHGHDHGHSHGHDHDMDSMSTAADSTALAGRDSLPMSGADTLANTPPPFPADSTYKMIKAYRNVKMYRSDSQMICDSLVSLNTDSIVRLYKHPIMWNESNQVTSDSMAIYTINQKLDKAHFMGTPLMISEIDTTYYNQVKGKEMMTYFKEGEMQRNDVNGNAQTIYYLQEEDNPDVTALMYIESANMSFYFLDGDVDQIVYKQNPEYVLYPIDMVPETQERRLPDFSWQIEKRPVVDSMIMREIRPTRRQEQHAKPTFRITERINYDRRRLREGNRWFDRIDVLPPEIIQWRNERPSYQQRKKR